MEFFKFAAARLRTPQGGHASGILSIRGPEVSPGSLRVEVYMARRLQRMRGRFQHISANSLNHPSHLCMNYLAMASRSPRWAQAPAYAVQALTHNQTYPDRPPGADLPPKKSVQFGPDGAPFPSKTSITRGPPVVAVAVSSDPILPQR